MRCPGLKDLPPPPKDRAGWPWTEESPRLPDTMPDGRPWPKISIVTPNYNYARFIEETIRSVLLQGYPDLEYGIIDDGSTDNSVDIIKKYEKWLTYWTAQPNHGQAHAINQGFKRVTGEIVNWLNSDDIYLPGVFAIIARAFEQTRRRCVIFGDSYLTDKDSNVTGLWKGRFSNRRDLIEWWNCWRPGGPCWLMQPATFFLKSMIDEVGLLDERLWMAMDYDLWIRISADYKFHYAGDVLATYRLHPASKSVTRDISKWLAECEYVSHKYWGSKLSPAYHRYALSLRISRRKERSKQSYNIAEKHLLCGHRWFSLAYLIRSILIFPPNLFSKNHLSLFLRALIGGGFS